MGKPVYGKPSENGTRPRIPRPATATGSEQQGLMRPVLRSSSPQSVLRSPPSSMNMSITMKKGEVARRALMSSARRAQKMSVSNMRTRRLQFEKKPSRLSQVSSAA